MNIFYYLMNVRADIMNVYESVVTYSLVESQIKTLLSADML